MSKETIRVFQNPATKNRVDFFNDRGISCDLNLADTEDVGFWLIHISDKPGIGEDGFEEFQRAENSCTGWRVYYSGLESQRETLDENDRTIKGLGWISIESNFDNFSQAISDGYPVADSLHALVGFDPKLEEFLKPFANLSPFQTGDAVRRAKKELDDYLAD